MRVTLPLLSIQPARAPILRYGVAVLSTTLALIPAVLLPNITESRLAVFAVAVMVSAWYGGWKPGLVATSFALTVSAYFSFSSEQTPAQFRSTMMRLALFVVLSALICWLNAALRAAQESLRRSELNFRSLVTNAPYGICRCNSEGQLLDVNPALLNMMGYSSAAELAGKHLGGLYADTHHWFELADRLHSSAPFNGLIAEWKRKDGLTMVVRVSGRAVSDGDKRTAFELFAEDVTERRALEQQLRQSQKMEAVGRLAGGIAHDFNNLLMVISGYSEFLLERLGPDPALRGPAQEIAAASQRASSLTRQLLAFSRKQMLAPKILDLNGVVTENLKMLTRVIGEDIDLVMVPGTSLGAVRADAGQIDQVIMNLAVNARDAMPSGGKLTIETSNISLDEEYARFHAPLRPGDYIMLSISDNGMGMDSETQSHIFEPFFTTKGPKGTGLGLSTVYGIIKQSGGYVWVFSEPGKGTTFKIYLPRVAERAEPAQVVASDEAAITEPGTETVLLAEDEANLRYLARQFLEKQGYTVLEAADGARALQIALAHQGSIHLLLTDVIMPGMNGRELAQRISEIRPKTKVLYMSGYTENVIGHNGTLDAGVRLLQKPFTLRELRNKVREVLDSKPGSPELEMPVRAVQALAANGVEQLPSARAPRFKVQLPLKYRRLDEEKWHDGKTRDISRSGLLFQADDPLQPNIQLEINLVLPAEIAGLSPTEVVCRGEIVRTVEAGSGEMPPAWAARILQYQFQHGQQLPRA
ncbi:MAG TPA: ATP-binding protein [Candidatus Sulfotelmatobacter sp.]|jgi:PAS domain S-box-containing protein|nr:ATP-binding protein [Candidatus Sulfotelmatobacter sp.]